MKAEVIMPLINELPINEKRRLLEWLKNEVKDVKVEPKVDLRLQQKLIKHITKGKNASKK